jgi:hypothetical protein
VDRDAADSAEARSRRQAFAVTLACGADVGRSRTLQPAVLTAAAIASRCFPQAVTVAIPDGLAQAPSLAWPGLPQTFGQALEQILSGRVVNLEQAVLDSRSLIFGEVIATVGLRVTFDGWVARVGPVDQLPRAAERPHNPLSGVLSAALAVSELFLGFANISLEAGRRIVGLSLWRPDLADRDPRALGPALAYLPESLWSLGLGHLGNAYLWALAALPYRDPKQVEFALLDFDTVEFENYETCLLFQLDDEHAFKSRVCSSWLEHRGFRTRLVERRFDEHFRVQRGEPKVAFCGFDSNLARQHLATAGFVRVLESGLGGTAHNFDTIGLHTLPNARSPAELWPVTSQQEEAEMRAEAERMVRDNAGYQALDSDNCGRALLAGNAVAVPFVGVTAATLVVAELLRLLHDGACYTDGKLCLGNLRTRAFPIVRQYMPQDLAGITAVDAT